MAERRKAGEKFGRGVGIGTGGRLRGFNPKPKSQVEGVRKLPILSAEDVLAMSGLVFDAVRHLEDTQGTGCFEYQVDVENQIRLLCGGLEVEPATARAVRLGCSARESSQQVVGTSNRVFVSGVLGSLPEPRKRLYELAISEAIRREYIGSKAARRKSARKTLESSGVVIGAGKDEIEF